MCVGSDSDIPIGSCSSHQACGGFPYLSSTPRSKHKSCWNRRSRVCLAYVYSMFRVWSDSSFQEQVDLVISEGGHDSNLAHYQRICHSGLLDLVSCWIGVESMGCCQAKPGGLSKDDRATRWRSTGIVALRDSKLKVPNFSFFYLFIFLDLRLWEWVVWELLPFEKVPRFRIVTRVLNFSSEVWSDVVWFCRSCLWTWLASLLLCGRWMLLTTNWVGLFFQLFFVLRFYWKFVVFVKLCINKHGIASRSLLVAASGSTYLVLLGCYKAFCCYVWQVLFQRRLRILSTFKDW